MAITRNIITDDDDEYQYQLTASLLSDDIQATDGNDQIKNIGVINYDTAKGSTIIDGVVINNYALNRDKLDAGAGDDVVYVQGFYVYYDADNLKFDGGSGSDTLDFSSPDSYTNDRRIKEGAGVLVDLQGGGAYTYYHHKTGFIWTDVEGYFAIVNFDNVTGTNQGDYINGNDSANVLDGGTLDYSLDYSKQYFGLQDHDPKVYGANIDIINGNGGNDTFKVQGFYVGGTYDGGSDIDTLDFSTSIGVAADRRVQEKAGVYVNLQDNLAYTYLSKYDHINSDNGTYLGDGLWTGDEGKITLKNIEKVIGTSQNDYIYGSNNKADELEGGAGNDYLHGGLEWNVSTKNPIVNKLHGGDGNDRLESSEGISQDELYGDAGDDYLVANSSFDIFVGGDGYDTVYFGLSPKNSSPTNQYDGITFDWKKNIKVGGFVPTGISAEAMIMTDYNDDVNVYKLDVLDIYGGKGNDRLTGQDSNVSNKLFGGDGNDILYGYGGSDILDGGEGNDIYIYNCFNWRNEGVDTLLSFDMLATNGYQDTLRLIPEGDMSKYGYMKPKLSYYFKFEQADNGKTYLMFDRDADSSTYQFERILDVTVAANTFNNDNLATLFETGVILV